MKTFIFKMAWRDSRASRRRLGLFSLSTVLGVALLVAIGSLSANLKVAVDTYTKGLLGADLIVREQKSSDAALENYLDTLGGERARDQPFSGMMIIPQAGGATRRVQGRALAGNFPFFGDFETSPADAPQSLRRGGDVVIVSDALFQEFHLHVGDSVRMGDVTLTVIGALQHLAGELPSLFTFAPTVVIPFDTLTQLGLGSKNAPGFQRFAVKLPSGKDADAIARDLEIKFRASGLRAETAEQRKRNFGRALDNLDHFLSLVGFVALFLGAIGVASTIHGYIRQKVATVAILRCLGASVGQSFSVYLLQGVVAGGLGAIAGAILGVATQLFVPVLLNGLIPFKMDFFLVWPAITRGLVVGMAITVLFTLLPLLEVRRVSPLLALRSAFVERSSAAPDPWRIVIGVLIVLAVIAFALWETQNLQIGFGYAAMLALSFSLLGGTAKLVTLIARRLVPRRLPYVFRQGVANLYRPNNRTVLLLLSLGLGTFLMLTLFLSRASLLRQFEGRLGARRANLVFSNIQEDEIDPLSRLATANRARLLEKIPLISLKLSAINGEPFDAVMKNRRVRDLDVRESVSFQATFCAELAAGERVVEGKFIGRAEAGARVIPISLNLNFLNRAKLKLGDEVVWDVQGVPLLTRIASVRSNVGTPLLQPFPIVFPMGTLEAAPKTYLATFNILTSADSLLAQRAIVAMFPKVTATDLVEIVRVFDGVFGKIAFAIEFLALFIVATGVVMLAAAIVSGRYQRIRETVLLRTLGATRRQLSQIQVVEYAILGFLSGLIGVGLAVLANALLAHYAYKIPAEAPVSLLLASFASVIAVTVLTGWFSNRGIADHPPLEVLRQET